MTQSDEQQQQSPDSKAEIMPVHTSKMTLLEPAAEIEELKRHWQKIQELKKSILDKADIAEIQGRTFVKRSGWRKLQSAFAISDRIVSKEREDQGDGHFLWRIEVEAYHQKTGRASTGVGACSTKERKFAHLDHDVFAIAHTRAKNRAISDLIGLGEVSAEEIDVSQYSSQSASSLQMVPTTGQQSGLDYSRTRTTTTTTETTTPATRVMSDAERMAREKAKAMGRSK
jgi:hypothetical protein